MTIVNPTALPSAVVSGGTGGSGGGAAPAINNVPLSDGAGGWAWSPALKLQATTGATGFALQNGTPTILSWTAPNDGNLHRTTLYVLENVTTNQTGGAISANINGSHLETLIPGGLTVGLQVNAAATTLILRPGDALTIVQSSALTAGASTLFAEIWAS